MLPVGGTGADGGGGTKAAVGLGLLKAGAGGMLLPPGGGGGGGGGVAELID